MSFKLKRITRTPYSEEINIYSTDVLDEQDEPVSMGKLHVHYVSDQIVGTLLIWQEFATGYERSHASDPQGAMNELINSILAEISEPIGVASDYGIEVYYPSTSSQGFVSNYEIEDGDAEDAQELSQVYQGHETTPEHPVLTQRKEDDDFAKKLSSRP